MPRSDLACCAEFAALRGPAEPRTPVSDGSHLTSSFFRFNTTNPSHLLAITHMVLSNFQQGPNIGSYAAREYLMKADLRTIRCPGQCRLCRRKRQENRTVFTRTCDSIAPSTYTSPDEGA
eukprot:640228-Rhodomonas_salina.2